MTIRIGEPDSAPPSKPYAVHLTLRRERVDVVLVGELDLRAAGDLATLFGRLAQLTAPVSCDLGDVTFADTHGLEPLVAAARRRRTHQLPPVTLRRAGRAVGRVLDIAFPGELHTVAPPAARPT